MIKKLTFLLWFFTSVVFSQNLEFTIIVKDFDTDLPIDEVTITAIRTRQGFLTNKEGKAIISLTRSSDLELVHSSYKTLIVKFSTLNKKENVVYMEPNTQQLEEYIITKDHPQEILKRIIENSKAKITIPISLKVYLHEFYKRDNEIIFFNDGLINFQILGNDKNIKTDILVEQNRAIGVLDGDIDADVLGYDLNNIIENYYQFKYLEEVLDSRARKIYDFSVKTYPSNEDYLVIKIVPLSESKGILSDFMVVYDSNKKLIIEVSSYVTPDRLQTYKESMFASRKVYKLEFKNTFRQEGNYYYLANSKEVIGFEKKYKNKERRIEVKNHMVITDFNKKTFEYGEKNIFKGKSLINKKTSFFTDYWDIESGFVSTAEEKAIIERLGKGNEEIQNEEENPKE
ncbi:hypothetical protein [Flavobacterium lacisediminis]|uniref:Carboxypeptidase-like regulatory domain-containing protein n=1 Tax=Flavobacterium lacisediminis TaxID=2989705 RepID=A0ABT3EI11_9FLAO|nr:hypothetical protein [Flavobacterium lacisediminis]MCW1148213.1 hypothetical protein [Flavobacterium lacisediminis]